MFNRVIYTEAVQMEKKKLVAILLACCMLVGTSLGAWVIHVKGATITGEVTSNKDNLVFIQNQFQDLGIIDVTNGSETINQTATIKNNNGALDFTIMFNETRYDVADDCTDYENDINITYFYQGSQVYNSDVVTVPSGTSELTAIFNVVRSACPQNITTSFELLEI